MHYVCKHVCHRHCWSTVHIQLGLKSFKLPCFSIFPHLQQSHQRLHFFNAFSAGSDDSAFLRYWRHSRAVWTCFQVIMATLHLAKASETDMSKPGMALGKLNGTWNTALFPSMVCRIKEHRSTRNRRGTWWCWSRPWMVMKRNPEHKTK